MSYIRLAPIGALIGALFCSEARAEAPSTSNTTSSSYYTPATAAAADVGTAIKPESIPWSHRFVVGANLEPFPIILANALITFEVAPAPWVSFEVGGGAVLDRPGGMAMLHLQAPAGRLAFGLEGGVLVKGGLHWSGGSKTEGFFLASDATSYSRAERLDLALFSRVGAAVAMRLAHDRLQLRIHVGASSLLNRSSAYCVSTAGEQPVHCGSGEHLTGIGPFLPYLGTSLGWTFDGR
jgi:hypothetical protein